MNKKATATLLTLIFLISALAVIAPTIPTVKANASSTLDVVPFILEAGELGTAEWALYPHIGSYSVMLSLPDDATEASYAEVSIPVEDITLGTLNLDTTLFWCKSTEGDWTPYFIFETAGGRINTDAYDSAGYVNWAQYIASDSPQFQWGDGSWHSWAETLTQYGADTSITRVYVELSGLTAPITAYVDGITINDVTYYGIIQDAIDAASAGDTILVHPGTYNESLHIVTGDLTIQSTDGADVTIVDVQGDVNGVWIVADDVTFTGFTVRGATTTGIQVEGSDIKILDNTIYGNLGGDTGINIIGSYNVTVAGNDIYNNTGGIGIAESTLIGVGPENNIYNNEMFGVWVYNCNPEGSADAVTIWGNNIYNDTAGYNQMIGIFVSNSGYVNASGNNLWGGAIGIMNEQSNSTIYSNNIIHDMVNADLDGGPGSAGIGVLGSDGVTISGNEIYNIELFGIAVVSSQQITIGDGNDVYGNGIGVLVASSETGPSHDISITGNSVHDSQEGIIISDSSNIAISNNDIVNNTGGVGSGISVSGTASTNITVSWNNIYGNTPYGVEAYGVTEPVQAGGNYWGSLTGPGGVASGSGDAVTDNVWYSPWLTRTFQTIQEDRIAYIGWETSLAKGWDIFSTPISLEGKTFFGDIVNEEDIMVAYKFNSTTQQWDHIIAGDTLQPLEAVYVRSNTDTAPVARITLDPTQTSPPMRQLRTGWNLIGPAPQTSPFSSDNGSMPVDQALVSVEQTAGGLTGYTIVVSPPINQESWTYTAGASSPPSVEPYQGYWVFMENDDVLAGFSTTPIIWGFG